MTCPRCVARGKTWNGSAPKCAFHAAEFNPDNWMCATMNDLRELAEKHGSVRCRWDQHAAIVPFDDTGCFIVLGWYKRRGRTEVAHVIDGETVRPLTLEDAEATLCEAEARGLPFPGEPTP